MYPAFSATQTQPQDHRPPLRPLGIGDLLDEMFAVYRRGFRPLVGIAALVGVPSLLLSIWQQQHSASGDPAMLPLTGFLLPNMLLVLTALQTAAICAATARLVHREPPSVAAAWRTARDTFWPLMRLAILGVVGYAGGIVALSIVVGLLVALGALLLPGVAAGIAPVMLGALLMVSFAIPILALLLILFMVWSLAVPVLVVEQQRGARRAIRRAWELARGGVGRIVLTLLTLLLMQLTAGLLAIVLTGQFAVLWSAATTGGMPAVATALTPASQPVGAWVVRILVSGSLGVLVAPLLVIGMTLLYFDRRVRVEAYDLRVQARELA
jgi:hypothetical protein